MTPLRIPDCIGRGGRVIHAPEVVAGVQLGVVQVHSGRGPTRSLGEGRVGVPPPTRGLCGYGYVSAPTGASQLAVTLSRSHSRALRLPGLVPGPADARRRDPANRRPRAVGQS